MKVNLENCTPITDVVRLAEVRKEVGRLLEVQSCPSQDDWGSVRKLLEIFCFRGEPPNNFRHGFRLVMACVGLSCRIASRCLKGIEVGSRVIFFQMDNFKSIATQRPAEVMKVTSNEYLSLKFTDGQKPLVATSVSPDSCVLD